MSDRLFGAWVRRSSGDVWDGPDEKQAKPVVYKIGDGWMVAGVRSVEELRALAELVAKDE